MKELIITKNMIDTAIQQPDGHGWRAVAMTPVPSDESLVLILWERDPPREPGKSLDGYA